jgi:uncharacterized protein involved in exopolysaccharide biosynthesis
MMTKDILKYLKIIRKWWLVILLLVASTVGTLVTIPFLTEPQYEATVTIQVSAPPPQEVPLYSSYNRQYLQVEIDRTRSSFSEFVLEGDIPYRAVEALPDIQMGGAELRDRIEIEIPEDGQLMRISIRASDPQKAALLADTVVDIGLTQYGLLLAQSTVNTRKFIEQELDLARTELRTAGADLTQFQVTHKIGSFSSAINSQHDILRSLVLQYDLARAGADSVKAAALDEVIKEREIELQNLIGLSVEYSELADHVDRVRATYNYLLDRRTEAQIKENQILELDTIQTIIPARPPSRPIAVISAKIIVLGGVVSLLMGMLLTFLLEYLVISNASHKPQGPADGSETMAPDKDLD